CDPDVDVARAPPPAKIRGSRAPRDCRLLPVQSVPQTLPAQLPENASAEAWVRQSAGHPRQPDAPRQSHPAQPESQSRRWCHPESRNDCSEGLRRTRIRAQLADKPILNLEESLTNCALKGTAFRPSISALKTRGLQPLGEFGSNSR